MKSIHRSFYATGFYCANQPWLHLPTSRNTPANFLEVASGFLEVRKNSHPGQVLRSWQPSSKKWAQHVYFLTPLSENARKANF